MEPTGCWVRWLRRLLWCPTGHELVWDRASTRRLFLVCRRCLTCFEIL
jgi:hypothetical protein